MPFTGNESIKRDDNRGSPTPKKKEGLAQLLIRKFTVGATIGRPRAFDERPYKTILNFLMRTTHYGVFYSITFKTSTCVFLVSPNHISIS